jgi:tRNA 2-selenouridine synthase
VDLKKNIKGLQPEGWSPLGPELFLQRSLQIPIIDVRAPKEFRQGHIPGAVNIPLFDDAERAVVGSTYSHNGHGDALLKGLEISGPKLKDFVKRAKETAFQGELLVHCWRGGMRSEAMAWLFTFSGIKTSVLIGGYKAYRRYIRESWSKGPKVVVLGGMTGSGKTEILHYLSSLGEQVLDLEGLANHKGSAFGALGQADQPTNEQFENDLAAKWLGLDPGKPVWIEDESRNIGRVIIPEQVFTRMADAPVVLIDVSFDQRVKRLISDYGSFNPQDLGFLIEKIRRRIGGEMANSAIQSLQHGDIENAVSTVLKYYDKAYLYGLSRHDKTKILSVRLTSYDMELSARQIIDTFDRSKFRILNL